MYTSTDNIKPKVSVIVPIYNTYDYLEKCLNSIKIQTLKDIEVLCVDDVSPDNSQAIVRQFVSSDSRFRLISHKHNAGAGGARNSGIAAARANYIANVDSDDYILPNMLQVLYEATKEETIDIVACGFDRVTDGEKHIRAKIFENKLHKNTNNNLNIFKILNPGLCNKLINKRLFNRNSEFFPINNDYEDLASTPRLVAQADSIQILEDRLYKYVLRSGSLSNSYTTKNIKDYFDTFAILRNYLQSNALWERYATEYLDMINEQLRCHTSKLLASDHSDEYKQQYLKNILYMKWAFLAHVDKIEQMSCQELRAAIADHSSPLSQKDSSSNN